MPKILFKNNAYSTLNGSITNVATTMSVQVGHGDRFPIVSGTDVAYVTLEDNSGNREIVKVTARAGGADSMTIARAQEGTSARAWNSGDVVELRITAGELDRYEQLSNVEDSASKATPVDADYLPLKDSAASNGLKYLTWANLKAAIKSALLAATSMIWTEAHIFRKANAIRSEAADTQDAVIIAGRAGGTASYAFTLTPAALTASRTGNLPDQAGTLALLENVQAQTGVAYATGGTSTAFTLTPTPALAALAENQEFDVEFHTAAGATPTLAISGLTAKSLKYRDSTGTLQAVTSTQIPSGWRSKVTYDGTDYIVREVPSSSAGLTLGTMQTWSSGVSQDFTGIPSTAKQITVSYAGISTTGSSIIILQLGVSGTPETSGYNGTTTNGATRTNWTNGIYIEVNAGSAAYTRRGSVILTLMDAATDLWSVSGGTSLDMSGSGSCVVAGTKALAGNLDTIRITSVGGTDTGDGGTWNIAY